LTADWIIDSIRLDHRHLVDHEREVVLSAGSLIPVTSSWKMRKSS